MNRCGELKNGLEKNIVKSVKRTAITERAICETTRAAKVLSSAGLWLRTRYLPKVHGPVLSL